MHLATFVILGALLRLHAVALRTAPWEDEERFGRYQEAWKVLNQPINTTYFLAKSTYPRTYLWHRTSACVRLRAVRVFESNKSAIFELKYKDVDDDVLRLSSPYTRRGTAKSDTYNITLQATRAFPYQTINNTISFNPKVKGRGFFGSVIFTNGASCHLISTRYEITHRGCELWVSEKRIEKIPSCCLFMYDYICPKAPEIIVYNKTICSAERLR
uniref:Putative lipocal-1 1 n=1 Tax=Amblyomma cajennense TaxID=34607 RepID=A0A023FQZ6_AMBCJ